MTLSWPDHQLTLADWEALPEDSALRLEVAEGMLVVSPKPLFWHQKASMRLGYWLDDVLPKGLTALTDVEVITSEVPLTIRVPDVVVVRTELYATNPPRCPAEDVLLAVEILSDGTRRVDRVLKFSEYAEAGIPQYWIVDLGTPTVLTSYLLVDGDYELTGEHTGAVTLDVAGTPVPIDLAALTAR